MKLGSFFESENSVCPMNLETGQRQKDNQRSLRPVPEAFKTLVDINFLHFLLILFVNHGLESFNQLLFRFIFLIADDLLIKFISVNFA